MAQELKSINLLAPAFKGINTEDSPIAQDPSFAEIADNAVIDKRGRIAARKGYTLTTTSATPLGSGAIRAIHEFEDGQGNTAILSVGNNKILSGTTTLADETPGSYTVSADNWKIVNFNNKSYFFQRNQEPLVYDGSSVVKLSTVSGAAGITGKYGNEVLSAFGRLWVADINNDKSTVYWSDLLIGHDFAGGTSGSINLAKVWPDGYDEIVALAAHNNMLIIFGRHSIVVYQGAEAPATMTLMDTVNGVGCVNRDTVQYTGTDVLFLSHEGLRSFGRVLQQKSLPITKLSNTITKDIIQLIQEENEFFRSAYSPEENFYLITFTSQKMTLCFNLKGTLEDGSYRVTRWPTSLFTAYHRKDNGDLLVGLVGGIGQYTGYTDNGTSFRFKYYSPSLSFGDSARIKILKKIRPVIFGGNTSSVFLKWAYDFDTDYKTASINIGDQVPSYFGIAEYNIGKYNQGFLLNRSSVNATSSGATVVVGVEADINGFEMSLQEINLLALVGKTI
jgi:hypothetical protein